MKIEVKNVEAYKKKLTVEVPAAEVQPYLEKAYIKAQGKIRIDGFRKGKAPMSLIRKRFGKAIEADAADDLVQEFYAQALNQEAISPVAPGRILDVQFEEGQPLAFTAEVEVEPEITVKDYTGIKVEKETVPVTDEDVGVMLNYLQEQHAKKEVVEGGAVKGSLIEGDIQALDATGFPIIGQKWEKRIIELGHPPFDAGVEDQLMGVKPGEERRIRMPVPPSEQRENQPAEQGYSIHVHQVYEKIIPGLDDAFAKTVGEFETLEQLKQQLSENLKAQREQDAEKAVRHKLSQEIVKRNDYTLPPAQVEHTLENLFEDEQKRAKTPLNKDQFLQQQRPLVIWGIKWDRIWHKITENESITITDEEVDADIERIAEANPEQEKRIRAQFKSEHARNRIRENLLEEKLFDYLKSNAKIKEVTVKPDKKKKSSIIT
ncbi:trigger factor [bacterium]|nr:trigger factor [bacterium]